MSCRDCAIDRPLPSFLREWIAGVSCLSCELTNCAAIVHPLLKEPRFIIPANLEEVDYICK